MLRNKDIAKAFFKDLENLNAIIEKVEWLEDIRIKSEYPLFRREDLPIWIPSERLTEEDAKKALENAEFVYNNLIEFIGFE